MLFFILVAIVFSAHAGDLTLRELEQKIINLDKLEHNMERLEKQVTSLKDELETKNNISEKIMQTISILDNSTELKQRLIRLIQIEKKLAIQKQKLQGYKINWNM